MGNPCLGWALGLVTLCGLAACDRRPETSKAEAPRPAAAAPLIAYVCEDGRRVSAIYPDPDTAVLQLDGKTHTLKIAISASGARYVGDGLQWWTKGMTDGQLSPIKPDEEIATARGVACKAPVAGG